MAPALRRAAGRAPRRLLVALVGLTLFAGIAAGLALPGSGAGTAADAPALPAEQGAPPALEWFDAPGVSPVGLWTTLGVVAAFAAVLFLLLKRARAPRGARGRLEVLDTLPLAGRRFLHLVRCGDLRLLVGSSEAGLFRVAALPPEGAEEAIEPSFAQLLDSEGARP